MRKTWHEKYRSRKRPIIEVTKRPFSDIPVGTRMVISTPAEIDRAMRKVPAGHEVTMKQLRSYLAWKHHVQQACPITTGIFLRIASEAAYEDLIAGQPIEGIMPFWRIVKPHSTIGKKLACGQGFLAQMRRAEGLPI